MRPRDTLSLRPHLVLLLTLVLGHAGCGGGHVELPPPDTSAQTVVKGVVTLNGKPFNGTGFTLILAADSGATALLPIGIKGDFEGVANVGSLKAGVLPEFDAQAAHGDTSKIPNPQTVSVSAGGSKDLKIDLSAPPAAAPKS